LPLGSRGGGFHETLSVFKSTKRTHLGYYPRGEEMGIFTRRFRVDLTC
jgi:hypothetical protein